MQAHNFRDKLTLGPGAPKVKYSNKHLRNQSDAQFHKNLSVIFNSRRIRTATLGLKAFLSMEDSH